MGNDKPDPDAETVRAVTGDDATLPADGRPATITAGPRTIGRFRIDGELGSGGMGDVYRAYDTVLERAVALKVLHVRRGDAEADQRRRVLREARAAAALAHANTVTIYDVGEAGGEVFIAMELLEGQVLGDALARTASMERKLEWLLEAARALEAAHTRGLVHRDVKPDNMFITSTGTLKLLDFGIAKRDDDEGAVAGGDGGLGPSSLRTTEGRIVGTPRYMAPEQRIGTATDSRTDQYAWGLVAFELLTGAHARADDATMTSSDPAVVSKIPDSTDRAARLRAVADLPEEIAVMIMRALEARKEERFDSMSPIVRLLEGTIAGTRSGSPRQATGSTSLPPAQHARRTTSWRRRALGGSGMVIVSALGLLLWVRTTMRSTLEAPGASGAPRGLVGQVPARCRAEPKRTYPFRAERDLMALAPDGGLYIARNDSGTRTYEREVDGRLEPVPAFEGIPLVKQQHIFGTSFANMPALLAIGTDGAAAGWAESPRATVVGHHFFVRRLMKPVTQADVTMFGESNAMVVSFSDGQSEKAWVGVSIVGDGAPSWVATVKSGAMIGDPTVAATPERLAIAFADRDAMSFAWIDRTGSVMGQVLPVAPVRAAPAIAFAGDAALVYWVSNREGGVRLMSARLDISAPSFGTAKPALSEMVANVTPVTGPMPDGTFGVAWVGSGGGRHTLRAARIDEAGRQVDTLDLATGTEFSAMRWARTPRGFQLAWVDPDRAEVHAVRVTCADLEAAAARDARDAGADAQRP